MSNNSEDSSPPNGWLKGYSGIANYAGVSRRTAQKWLSLGLNAKRITDRMILVRPADVDVFIETQAEKRTPSRDEADAHHAGGVEQ